MYFRRVWQRITTSQRTREREAAAQSENAQRESALREEFARRSHALEAQIAQAHVENCRLRAENRALLNSVLGIAGIPPVIVTEPPDLPFVGAQHAVPGADAGRDVAHTAMAPSFDSRHCEERSDDVPSSRLPLRDEQHLLVSSGSLDAKPKRDPSSLIKPAPQDDGAADGYVAPDGTASPSTFAGHSGAMPPPSQTPYASAPPATNAAPQQQHVRRARGAPHSRSDAHAIAPIRRRSWHQIYRMLEFESSRRKDQDS